MKFFDRWIAWWVDAWSIPVQTAPLLESECVTEVAVLVCMDTGLMTKWRVNRAIDKIHVPTTAGLFLFERCPESAIDGTPIFVRVPPVASH